MPKIDFNRTNKRRKKVQKSVGYYAIGECIIES